MSCAEVGVGETGLLGQSLWARLIILLVKLSQSLNKKHFNSKLPHLKKKKSKEVTTFIH